MLYPQLNKPLTPKLFQNPTSEYRGTPFWAWNCKLEEAELTRQIDILKKMGYGGFHMHVRTGMAITYLSDDYMDLVQACVEKARSENMLAWLYDEDRWPSGAAGGYVTKDPRHRIHHLLLTRSPYGTAPKAQKLAQSKATSMRTENGSLLACYDICLADNGSLKSYRRISPSDTAEGFKLYAYMESALPSPWFNNQTYVDTLSAEAIAEFIRVTYDRYNQRFAEDFGGVIPAIFTDEPQFSHKGTLGFAHENCDVTLPWTPGLEDTFAAAYGGESLIDGIPELLWELAGNKISTVRYHYHDHIAQHFAEAFADQCGDWCQKHGLMLTGHMMEEPTLETQTKALGEAMRSYRAFHLPGIDMLCDRREYTTAKQAQSAAHQYGVPGIMSELYGVTNWDFDFRGHKLHGDWQAALGVTVRVPHLSWVSMNGEAKRDYPATFNYQAPWHEEYSYIEDHFARVNTATTRGRPVVRVGVIHPVESYWLHWGAKENTRAIREQMDTNFQNLTWWLLSGQIDFDFISESLLIEQNKAENITSEKFPVGEMSYDVIIVPGCETLRSTTLERLEAFRRQNGDILFLGGPPTHVDAIADDRGARLYESCRSTGFQKTQILDALEKVREVEIRGSDGSFTDDLIYQLRQDGDDKWLFVAHATNPVNKDVPKGDLLLIKIKGQYHVTLYDTISGSITPIEFSHKNGHTTFSYPFYDHDSLLVRLDTSAPDDVPLSTAMAPLPAENAQRYLDPVPVTLDEPNVLLLDMAEYALNKENYQPMEEILRIDNILRRRLEWPLRGEAVAQPWVGQDNSTPHTLRLRYTFYSGLPIDGAKLALENAANTVARLNGVPVDMALCGWYTDKCIGTVTLPGIKTGKNILELEIPYGTKVDVESCYILGDFGVNVSGCVCTLTAPVAMLAFGNIANQGLPFYGGNIVYHLIVETSGEDITLAVPSYRGHLLSVFLDGEEQGKIVFSPYRLALRNIPAGVHKLEIKYFGSRVNTFGQLHHNNRVQVYWGPNSWRTTGDEWTYEYRFWEQGILKSPEIAF